MKSMKEQNMESDGYKMVLGLEPPMHADALLVSQFIHIQALLEKPSIFHGWLLTNV
ncbi:MAG: hypothetical protein ABW139_02990 [Candidatus Thiodiazotropha sp. DIVDIV]